MNQGTAEGDVQHGSDDSSAARWMSGSDAVIWRIERDPLLRSTVVVVFVLERSPDPQRLAAR
jgi:hypothetical protein